MTSWDDAAPFYLQMVRDPAQGFNHLAGEVAEELAGRVDGRSILDVGCGEGSFARRLAQLGAQVTGTEPTVLLRDAAVVAERQAPLGIDYHGDRAEELRSVESASVDVVVALLVLHHVDDLGAALGEMRRVLRPDGALILVVPHPLTDHPDAGWTTTADAPRRTIGSYLDEGHWQSDAPGTLRSVGWHHRTLATWLNAIAHAGFVLEAVREPVGHEPRRPDAGGPWQKVPRFLAVRARGA